MEDDGYLDGATLVPHSELQDREDELPEDKDAAILLYCRSGNRSQQAAETLQDMGLPESSNWSLGSKVGKTPERVWPTTELVCCEFYIRNFRIEIDLF